MAQATPASGRDDACFDRASRPEIPHHPARFAPGTRVRVRAAWPEAVEYVHLRTPSYIRGHEGVVERCFGVFSNPEDLAFGRPPQKFALYHVAFDRATVWPGGDTAPGDGANTDTQTATRGRPHTGTDTLLVEIYEHWLEEIA